MRKTKVLKSVAVLAFLIASLGLLYLNVSGHGKAWVDIDSAGVQLYQGGFQEWVISWSKGESYDTNLRMMKRFWCKPTFVYVDFRADGTNINPGLLK